MRRLLLLVFSIVVALAICAIFSTGRQSVFASVTGTVIGNNTTRSGKPGGTPGCGAGGCHVSANANITTTIAGSKTLAPGTSATYTITAGFVTATAYKVGIDVAADDANSLGVGVDTFTQIPSGSQEVTHKPDAGSNVHTISSNSATYSYLFTMPAGATCCTAHKMYGVAAVSFQGWALAPAYNVYVAPAAPSSVTASNVTSTSVTLNWSGGGPEYRALYKLGSAPTSTVDGTLIYEGANTTANATGLSASTNYGFAVFSKVTGDTAYSTTSVTTSATTSFALDPNPWVDAVSGSDTANGSQATPFKTIKTALTAVGTTGTIHVKPGTYNTTLGETFPITMPSGRKLQSTNGAATTIIDATGANQTVLVCSGNASTTLVEGFTITGGLSQGVNVSPGSSNGQGGGIFSAANDQTTISRCIITGNQSRGYDGNGTNFATAGPAYGGGAYLNAPTKLINCIISNNTSRGGNGFGSGSGGDAHSGGVQAFSTTTEPHITNCTFYGNTALGGNGAGTGSAGGALYPSLDGQTATITNDIFANNTASPGTGSGTPPNLGGVSANNGTNNLFFPAADSSGFVGTSALTNTNPLFVNAPGDLHLRSSSPARRAGTTVGAPTVDLDNNPRTSPPTIGAYEIGLFLTATGGIGRITVTWSGVSGATSYNLYMSQTAGVTTSTFQRKVAGATSPFILSGLPNNTTYYFVITAIESGVEGPISPEVSATTTNGTWARAGILPGSGFTNLTRDLASGTTLYATANDSIGLYKSTDSGDTWTGLTGAFNGTAMRAVAANGTTVLVAGAGNIYRSTDGGSTWAAVVTGAGVGETVESLAIDPLAPMTVYAADFALSAPSSSNLIAKSVNGGLNFASLASANIRGYYIQVDPATAGTLYIAGSGTPNIVSSTDGGNTFTSASPVGGYPNSLALAPSQTLTLYSGLRDASNSNSVGVYKTINGGTNWTQLNTGLPTTPLPDIYALLVDPANVDRVHAGSTAGYYTSTDGAANWVAGPSGGPYPSASLLFNAFAQTSTGRLIGTTSSGIFILTLTGPPSITNALPSAGSTSGGDQVTVTGSGFVAASGLRVLFGGIDGSVNLAASSSTSITVTTPANALGTVDVVVINPDGQSAVRSGGFTYVNCPYDVSPASANYSSAAATGSAQVSAQTGCPWTATAPGGSFVTITGGSSGNGSGTVSYSVGQNTTGAARSTTLTIAGKSFVVTQSAAGVAAMTLNAVATVSQVSLSWSSVGANSYEIQRSNNGGVLSAINSTAGTVYTDSTVANGTGYLYRIRAIGSSGDIAFSNVDLAVPFAYTYPSITAGVSVIHAADVSELRQALNAARAALGWTALSFTDPVLTNVVAQAIHFTELRSGVDGVRGGVGLPPMSYTDPTLTPGSTLIRAAHVTDLRAGLQ